MNKKGQNVGLYIPRSNEGQQGQEFHAFLEDEAWFNLRVSIGSCRSIAFLFEWPVLMREMVN
ncbi:hypothetical protein MKW98_016538, partial [Papaver atlanticum]